ncbi:hypothetical protein PSTT_12441 [Puccinia striiformis]|uniref:Uncharacterized protein n=1 Tax=Puccinia striiformis TaxID=27350 RepID=A0A2S4UW66_9BASI|nr:hypothetical protein PSTT_12441 [Puccinia striiformis]
MTQHHLPYSNLPNTRPQDLITTGLRTHLQDPAALQPLPPRQSINSNNRNNKAKAFYRTHHSLLLVRRPDLLQPRQNTHALHPTTSERTPTQLATPFSHLLSDLLSTPLPTELIVPSLAFIKSLSGFCLLHTGSTIRSYSINSLMVYTLLASSICLSANVPQLTQVLLDIEDQQAFQANRLTLKSSSLYRKHTSSSSRQSNKLSPQARYQHLMNPF